MSLRKENRSNNKKIPTLRKNVAENKNITRLDDQVPKLKYRTDETFSKVKFIQNIVSYSIKKPL